MTKEKPGHVRVGSEAEVGPLERHVRLTPDCVAKLGRSRLHSLVRNFSRPLVCASLVSAAVPIRGYLREASSSQWWRGTAEKLGQPPQILRRCCEQHFVSGTTQTPQPKSVEPENAFHMRKSHLDLLALAARLLEGFRIGQRTDTITDIFVEVAGDFAHDRRRALRLL